jgi:bacterial/archaeal transporter family-2 protein
MIFALALALFAGLLLPLQAGINSELRSGLGDPLLATLASFLVGTVGLALVLVAARVPVPSATTLATPSWWQWSGGLLGAVYILVSIVVAPRLGAATMIATIVAGQMLASLLLDHFGLVGYVPHALNGWRLLGAALVIGGAILIQRH